jgi:opacity protein-like surface antigen
MKKINIALIGLAMSASTALASTPVPYIEGQINYTQVDDVDTETYSGSAGGLTFSNLKATNEYDSDIGFGFEVGAKGLVNENIRLGFSYGESKIELKSTTGSGTVTDGTTTVNFAVRATRADLASVGLSFDNDIKSYSLNGYYDFSNTGGLIPFVGLGIGQVDIENAKDKELSTSLYLGARYFIDKNLYVGGKGTYTRANGPEDKLGIKYEDITQYGLTLSVGYQF